MTKTMISLYCIKVTYTYAAPGYGAVECAWTEVVEADSVQQAIKTGRAWFVRGHMDDVVITNVCVY